MIVTVKRSLSAQDLTGYDVPAESAAARHGGRTDVTTERLLARGQGIGVECLGVVAWAVPQPVTTTARHARAAEMRCTMSPWVPRLTPSRVRNGTLTPRNADRFRSSPRNRRQNGLAPTERPLFKTGQIQPSGTAS